MEDALALASRHQKELELDADAWKLHLVHTDPKRLEWFREVLTKTALNTQVIVLTCRPEDYVSKRELPTAAATRDLAGAALRVIDMLRLVKRW